MSCLSQDSVEQVCGVAETFTTVSKFEVVENPRAGIQTPRCGRTGPHHAGQQHRKPRVGTEFKWPSQHIDTTISSILPNMSPNQVSSSRWMAEGSPDGGSIFGKFCADGNFKADHLNQLNHTSDIQLTDGEGFMTAPEAYDKHIKEAVRKANRFIQVSPPDIPSTSRVRPRMPNE